MSNANEKECLAAGIDPKIIESLGRRFEKLGKEAQKHHITIFGGSGSGTLRSYDDLILYVISEGNWDGGDGHFREANDGLLRGEASMYG